MKIFWFIIFSTAFLIFGCKDDSFIPNPPEEAENPFHFQADTSSFGAFYLTNGVRLPSNWLWVPEYEVNNDTFSLVTGIFTKYKFWLKNIPIEPGKTFEVKQKPPGVSSVYYIMYPDGDVAEDNYRPDSTVSWLNLTNYDPATGIAEGRFDMTMYVQLPKTDDKNPDTIRFEHGYFRVKVKRQ